MSRGLIGVSNARSQKVLNQFTVPGAFRTAVDRYEWLINDRQKDGIDGMALGLQRYPQSGIENTYHTDLMTDVYNVGLQGLEGDSQWSNVLAPFIGEIGKGVGGRLSGKNPYITSTNNTVIAPPEAAKTPGWVVPTVIGGAVLVLGGLFFALRK